IPYRIVNAPALRRRGGRVAEDCVMTITRSSSIALLPRCRLKLGNLSQSDGEQIGGLVAGAAGRSCNDQYFSLLLSQSILTLRGPHIVNWGIQRCADSALVK